MKKDITIRNASDHGRFFVHYNGELTVRRDLQHFELAELYSRMTKPARKHFFADEADLDRLEELAKKWEGSL